MGSMKARGKGASQTDLLHESLKCLHVSNEFQRKNCNIFVRNIVKPRKCQDLSDGRTWYSPCIFACCCLLLLRFFSIIQATSPSPQVPASMNQILFSLSLHDQAARVCCGDHPRKQIFSSFSFCACVLACGQPFSNPKATSS